MNKQIFNTVAAILLIFSITFAQQQNERLSRRGLSFSKDNTVLSSSPIEESLPISVVTSDRVHREADIYRRGNIFGLRNHRVSTAHHVNASKFLTDSNSLVKVYGEANPSKTDEHLLDIEANTQIVNVGNRPLSLIPSGESIPLSISGYGPPEEKLDIAETNHQAETIKEIQAILHSDIENPYDGGVPDTEAITAETPSDSNRENKSDLPLITSTEKTVILSEAATSTIRSEDFRKTESVIKSNVSDMEPIKSSTEACAQNCSVTTESSMGTDEGTIEMVTEASTDRRKGATVLSTGISKESYDVSTEQFENASIGTEDVEISTIEGEKTESVSEGYGTVFDTKKAEIVLKTKLQNISSADAKVMPSESVTESFTNDDIMHTQTKSIDDAEDFGYGMASKTIKEQSTTEKSPSSISENSLGAYKVESTSNLGEAAYSATSSPMIGEETKYKGQEKPYENGSKPDSNTEEIYSSQQKITKVSGDTYQNQENIDKTEMQTNTDQSSISTKHWSGNVEVTLPITNGTATDTLYVTEDSEISKIISSPIIEPEEDISGYETYSKPKVTAISSKVGLPGLNKESASQLSKSIEEATMVPRISTETKMRNEKAKMTLESTVTGLGDLKSSTESNMVVTETIESPKETSLTSVEQSSEYRAVTPEYIAESTYGKEEATELRKTNDGVETSAVAPYDTNEKVVPDTTSVTSSSASVTSESVAYGTAELVKTSVSEKLAKVSKSDEGLGLAGYGKAGPSEQVQKDQDLMPLVSSTEESGVSTTKTPEETIQRNELQTMMVSKQLMNHNEEIATSESSKISSTTATSSNEATMSEEVTRSEQQPSDYRELSVTADDYHESNKEVSSEQATIYKEQVTEYELLTSAISKGDITTEKGVNATARLQSKYADIRTTPGDFGYGGKKGVIEENDSDAIDTLVNSISTINVEESTENPYANQLHTKLTENAKISKPTGESVVTESIEKITSGRGTVTNESDGSAPESDVTENPFNLSDYYPTSEETTNELSRSDENLTGQSEIAESTLISITETSEIASVNERTTSHTSLTSENPESEAASYAVSEGGKFTGTSTAETTVLAQVKSNETSTDTNDFGYGEKLEENTEAQLIEQNQDSRTFVTAAESILTTGEIQFSDEIKTESVQKSLATETPSEIETDSTIKDFETSQQNHTEIDDILTSSSLNKEAIETTGISETDRSALLHKTYPQETTESTLMRIVTNGVEMSIPYDIHEEAPKIIAMIKVTKKGPSKLADDIIASTKAARKEEIHDSTETTKEFEAGSITSEEMNEVKNEIESISSETSWASPEFSDVTTAAKNTESEFYSENTANISVRISMGPENFGYENVNELTSPSEISTKITMTELPINLTETSIATESSVSNKYTNSKMFADAESKGDEEFSGTVPSITSNALTDSSTVTQKMLTTHGEIITTEEEKNIPINIPNSGKDFGYGDDTDELSNSAAFSSITISDEQKQRDQSVLRNTGRPFTLNCDEEIDEKGDLCKEWAKAGLCDAHRPTMFLFCRRTCLCIGPPIDLLI
ncbi:unnamed protein product [Acanthocheilonema viteae]|uniref:ShKT domain-containing protein n=1 Tax=Acanthocheilonema viteae TaxID=6277 RepID=A0A498SAP2_ACAVI|nr:unnamed protein product [Acanthocheilonema viteae]